MLTDFRYNQSKLPRNQITVLRWILFTLIGIFLSQRNWVILADLLLCCHCLQWYPQPIFEIALECLLATQEIDGSITDKYFKTEEYEKMNHYEARSYNFKMNYHVTLSISILCFLLPKKTFRMNNSFFAIPHTEINPSSKKKLFCKRSYEWLRYIRKDLNTDYYDEISLLYVLIGEWIHYKVFNKDISTMYVNTLDIIKTIDTMDKCEILESIIPTTSLYTKFILIAYCILRSLKIKSIRLETTTKKIYYALKNYEPRTSQEGI